MHKSCEELERSCDECTVCCVIPKIDELKKLSCTSCIHLTNSLCSIQSNKPKQCSEFDCYWLLGFGKTEDRPDKSGVMVWTNITNGGQWILVTDLVKNAHRTTGKQIIDQVIKKHNFPAIIVDNKNLADGVGDYVIIKDELLKRSSKIKGNHIQDNEYELVVN